jgi:hypothetical protein
MMYAAQRLLLVICLLCFAMQGIAQYKDPTEQPSQPPQEVPQSPPATGQEDAPQKPAAVKQKNKKEGRRWAVGGSLGLAFGTITNIEVAPSVMYLASERLRPGLGAQYSYYSRKYSNTTFSTSIYGGRSFLQYVVHPNVFAWGEVEALNAELYDINTGESVRDWLVSPLLGGGYRQAMGEAGSFNLMLLYNMNYDSNRTIYASPLVIRFGVWF